MLRLMLNSFMSSLFCNTIVPHCSIFCQDDIIKWLTYGLEWLELWGGGGAGIRVM
jgi:hypothetical protein